MHMQANTHKIKIKPENKRLHLGLSSDDNHSLMPDSQRHRGKARVTAAKAFTTAWGILCLSAADGTGGCDCLPSPALLLV